MSTRREFIARGRTVDEVARDIGCDHLVFQSIPDMLQAVKPLHGEGHKFCTACFDGNYPTGDVTETMLSEIENERLAASGKT
jgi:amidophosphoribosyltransferase